MAAGRTSSTASLTASSSAPASAEDDGTAAPIGALLGDGGTLQLRAERDGYLRGLCDAAVRPDLHDTPARGDGGSGGGGGGGSGLPESLQAGMSRSFQTDFSDVRVHQDSSFAADLGAHAFARGDDLHFAPGHYDPSSTHGRELIGHELAHVVQQRDGRVAATVQASGAALNDDAALEAEADEHGARAARGEVVARVASPAKPSSTASPVAQGKLSDAQAYARKHLGHNGVVNMAWVTGYVNNPGNPPGHRRGLLQAFNRGHTERWKLAEPADLHAPAAAAAAAAPVAMEEVPLASSASSEEEVEQVEEEEEAEEADDGGGMGAFGAEHGELDDEEEASSESSFLPTPMLTSAAAQAAFAGSPFVMGQFGGGTGSRAGDAALLSARQSRRELAIDLGTGGQREQAARFRGAERKMDPTASESEWEDDDDLAVAAAARKPAKGKGKAEKRGRSPVRKHLLLTHAHADHVGKPGDRSAFERVHTGASAPELPAAAAARVQPVPAGGGPMFAWRQKRGQLSVGGSAIAPLPVEDAQDANEESLGALLRVDQRGDDGAQQRLFSMLTMGDMTPHEARGPVDAAVAADGHVPDVIKIPHHGSEHNLAAIPPKAIGKHTRILISGYTMTATAKLAAFVKANNPGEVFILFESREVAERLTSTEAWKRLKELGVQVARDYYIYVDADGEVRTAATKF